MISTELTVFLVFNLSSRLLTLYVFGTNIILKYFLHLFCIRLYGPPAANGSIVHLSGNIRVNMDQQ
jgi:hypothetical protein